MIGPFRKAAPVGTAEVDTDESSLDLSRNSATQRKQQMMLWGLGGVVVIAGMAYILAPTSSDQKAMVDQTAKNSKIQISTDDMVNRNMSDKEWMGMSESQLNSQGNQIKALQGDSSKIDQLTKQVQDMQAENNNLRQDGTRVLSAYSDENSNLKNQLNTLQSQVQKVQSSGPSSLYGPTGPGTYKRADGSVLPGAYPPGTVPAGSLLPAGVGLPMGPSNSIKMMAFSSSGDQLSAANKIDRGKGTSYTDSESYLPPNSIATAKVIVGVDATTNVKSQTDPLPVVLRITGPARSVYANGKLLKTNVVGCMVNGAAMADLSSEKVYVKLQRMTCPQPGGRFAVSEVKGFIAFGGKTGVRGHVVSRAGNLVGQAFLAGIAGGFGRGFSANSRAALTAPAVNIGNGTVPQLSAGQLVTGGLGEGVATASDQVSKYLIDRAEQYQPVVEMPTGLDVEVVFLDGVFIRN